MENQKSITSILLAIFLFSLPILPTSHSQLLPVAVAGAGDPLQTYIVHVQKAEDMVFGDAKGREEWHKSFLPNTTLDSGQPRIVYSYENSISGFAARLTPEELKVVQEKEGFLFAQPDRAPSLETTHTPEFLGLNSSGGLWNDANMGEGIVIGIVDTGIYPYHLSFNDDGMSSPPARWRGYCDPFMPLCNNKIVGARVFDHAAYAPTPYDEDGHGTHVASVAAGSFVGGADVLGYANGTAAGMAPRAHVAVYKVGTVADILASFDQAIYDGVDVISISLSDDASKGNSDEKKNFYENDIAIGALSAVEKGIFVSSAAGNYGPFKGSLRNDAPWILTVGASTVDRALRTIVKLGSGPELRAESVRRPESLPSTRLPLAFPGADHENGEGEHCTDESLYRFELKGKVVLCTRGNTTDLQKSLAVEKAGGIALIILNRAIEGSTTSIHRHDSLPIPAVSLGYVASKKIADYVKSAPKPTATLFDQGTIFGVSPHPAVPFFSSRGPSSASNGVLKPDVIGPGVNILGASISSVSSFTVMSGTSMAASHLSGIVALIKSSHPYWSPAAVKSAILTTADRDNNMRKGITDETTKTTSQFATGSGNVRPWAANDPGIVYDIHPHNYVPYLCGLGYGDRLTSVIARRRVDCSSLPAMSGEDLNYPSISASVVASSGKKTITRTVTNVGRAGESYRVVIRKPPGVSMSVFPRNLTFTRVNQKKIFSVSFVSHDRIGSRGPMTRHGWLRWVSDKHEVTTSVSVTTVW